MLAEQGWKHVYDFIRKRLKKNAQNYVFIDEVQNISGFEKLLEGLFVTPNVDTYVYQDATPLGLCNFIRSLPRVARIRASAMAHRHLGCVMKPRWSNVARMGVIFCGGEERVTALDFVHAKDVLFTKQIQSGSSFASLHSLPHSKNLRIENPRSVQRVCAAQLVNVCFSRSYSSTINSPLSAHKSVFVCCRMR